MASRRSKSGSPAEENPALKAAAQNGSFPVVAIGASAGGLEAYTEFFKALPGDLGMAFVLVQHLDPSHHSLLAEIIAKATKMPVEEVKIGVKIRPNCVYVIPHNALMAISAGLFTLTPRSREPGQHLSVNFFMRSLAQERKGRAIGIVLSGTGADGTLGLEDIKAEGGITFAQDPASAKYDGMPRSAVDSGCVDFVLPPKEIPKELQRITRHPYVSRQTKAPEIEPSPAREDDFTRIIDQLRRTGGVDFSQYKANTIHRRAMRRMVILKLDSLREYAKYLKEHPEEAEKLYNDVLIPVTSFFRDFEAFEALKSEVYPAIVKDKGNKGTIRMWAPGCSTGEETYSLAMTLLEFLGDKAASFQVQIFGTDLNEKGIQRARAGVYRESIAEEISSERMRRFFVKVEAGYRVNKAVREMCIFARQNLASDPPFSQMNVVVCRNLLIYVQLVLQKKIVPILHDALKPSGFLVLGSSESVSAFPDLFSTVDKEHKIYAKKAISSRLHYDFSQTHYPTGSGADIPGKTTESQGSPEPEVDVQIEADRLVLKNYAPVGVVINANLEVIQFRGRTTPYLEPAPGKASLNVLKLARNGLAIELSSLINAARRKGAPVKKDGVPFDGNGHKRILNIFVFPLGKKSSSAQERRFLILFEDVTSRSISGSKDVSEGRLKAGVEMRHEFKRLKQELAGAQDLLRAAIESEDALKEEFQSANEEILSANEELQSSNEELETSKEELQSANEELSTLTNELRHNNSELQGLSNDLSNFLASTRIPVVMLDRNLRIRRLTPNVDKLLKAAPSDIGRPISNIRLNIKVSDLEPMIMKVLDGLQPSERDVQDLEGCWHSLHILPYETLDNKIDGVVLVLQDIDAIKSANEQLSKSTEFFRGIMNTVREPLLVLDSTFRIIAVNESFLRTFSTSSEQTVNKCLYRIGNEQWNITKLRVMLEQVLPEQQAVMNFEVEHEFENIGHRTMLLNSQVLSQTNNLEPMILLAIEDITERRRAEAQLEASRIQLESSARLAALGMMAGGVAHEINNPLAIIHASAADLLHRAKEEGTVPLEIVVRNGERIQQTANRLAKMIKSMRYLAREGSQDSFCPTPVAKIVEEALEVCKQRFKDHSVNLLLPSIDPTLCVLCREVQVAQVLLNLLQNAFDAVIEQAGERWIRLDVAAQDSSAVFSVIDSGPGIPPELQTRIMEPFFTTKEVGKGTGLGLSLARTIVEEHGGKLELTEETGHTCFSFRLPLSQKEEVVCN
jgi:two-component system CheB/CheR fusion protein